MVQVRDDPIVRAMERTGIFPWYAAEEEKDFHLISHGAAVTASPQGEAFEKSVE